MYCVDVLANVTVNVLTGRPSEVQSFHLHPWHRVECAHSSLELQWHLRGHTCRYSWQRQWADFDKYMRD